MCRNQCWQICGTCTWIFVRKRINKCSHTYRMHSLFGYQKAISMPESRLYINIYIYMLEVGSLHLQRFCVDCSWKPQRISETIWWSTNKRCFPVRKNIPHPSLTGGFIPSEKKHVIGDHHPKYGWQKKRQPILYPLVNSHGYGKSPFSLGRSW